MKLQNYIGLYIILLGLIHSTFGVIVGWNILEELLKEGLFNALGSDLTGANLAGHSIVWFIFVGLFWLPLGHLIHWIVNKKNIPIPKFIAIHLIIINLLAVILVPKSGYWLFFPVSIYILFDKE